MIYETLICKFSCIDMTLWTKDQWTHELQCHKSSAWILISWNPRNNIGEKCSIWHFIANKVHFCLINRRVNNYKFSNSNYNLILLMLHNLLSSFRYRKSFDFFSYLRLFRNFGLFYVITVAFLRANIALIFVFNSVFYFVRQNLNTTHCVYRQNFRL